MFNYFLIYFILIIIINHQFISLFRFSFLSQIFLRQTLLILILSLQYQKIPMIIKNGSAIIIKGIAIISIKHPNMKKKVVKIKYLHVLHPQDEILQHSTSSYIFLVNNTGTPKTSIKGIAISHKMSIPNFREYLLIPPHFYLLKSPSYRPGQPSKLNHKKCMEV